MQNYDPNISFGTHVIEVYLQQWEYKGTFTVKRKGNCKGADILHDVHELVYDDLKGTPAQIILKDDDANELVLEDEEEREYDWIVPFVVGARIIEFIPEIR